MMMSYLRNKTQSLVIKLIFAVIVLVFIFWGVGTFSRYPQGALLKVNDEFVMYPDYYQRINSSGIKMENLNDIERAQIKNIVLQELVNEKLIEQAGTNLGIVVTDPELVNTIAQYDMFRNAEGKFDKNLYRQLLANAKMTDVVFEKEERARLLREKTMRYIVAGVALSDDAAKNRFMFEKTQKQIEYILYSANDLAKTAELTDAQITDFYEANKIAWMIPEQLKLRYVPITPADVAKNAVITDEAARVYYDANVIAFVQPASVSVRHILFGFNGELTEAVQKSTLEKTQTVLADIQAGTITFEDAAKEFSSDEITAGTGGMLGIIVPGSQEIAFETASFALAEGDLSAPVLTSKGYHIIRADVKTPEAPLAFEEVAEAIKTKLATEGGYEEAGRLSNALGELMLTGQSMEEAASSLGLEVQESNLLTAADLARNFELGTNDYMMLKDLVAPAFHSYTTTTGYIVAQVIEKVEEAAQPLENVRVAIEERLRFEEGTRLAHEAALATVKQLTTEGAEFPAEYGALLKTSDFFGRFDSIIGVGQSELLSKDIFEAKDNNWFKQAYQLEGGSVVAHVVASQSPTEEEWSAVAESYKATLFNELAKETFGLFLKAQVEKSEILTLNQQLIDSL